MSVRLIKKSEGKPLKEGMKAMNPAPFRSDKFSFPASLILPVLILMVFAGIHERDLRAGRTFAFPVQKPPNHPSVLSKSFLSGWRLEYRTDYGLLPDRPLDNQKKGRGGQGGLPSFLAARAKAKTTVFLCLQPERRLARRSKDCPQAFIKGRLVPTWPSGQGEKLTWRFQAKNLHRFYLPEKQTEHAEKLFLQAERTEILVSVTKRGAASLQDVLIDGRSLKKILSAKNL